ncbi:MAG: hypothetical protein RDU20_15830 [Desulfomonilaceae bacterium]|nr:hypothetical protein [Desulfomonilaceae bacterium]
MEVKRTIRAKDIVSDLRSGLTNLQLMDKYGLSSKGLQSVFVKLVQAKALREGEFEGRPAAESPRRGQREEAKALREGGLDGRAALADDTVNLDQRRVLPRNFVVFRLPVYDNRDMTLEGHVRDITERGLQVAGIPSSVGDSKTLIIRPDEFADIYPFVIEVLCRWANPGKETEPCVSGYEITEISEESKHELRKLVRVLTFGA